MILSKSPLATKLEFIKDEETGEIKDYEEVSLEEHNKDENGSFYEKATNANSLSLQRMPAFNQNARGNSEFFPFKPANLKMKMERELFFEKMQSSNQNPDQNNPPKKKNDDILEFDDFLTKPDDFPTGLINNQLPDEIKNMFSFSNDINDELLNDIDQFKKESEIRKRKKNEEKKEEKRLRAAVVSISIKDCKDDRYFDAKFVKILDTEEKIENFDQLLPNPAKKVLI